MTQARVVICPYCGETQPAAERCRGCGGLFEPLSRQATHNAMGPWFVRDPGKPFHPGCSYETLVRMIDRGQVTKYSILRGPTTRQFWTVAKHVAGVSHMLGYCHNCDASVDPGDHGCHVCGVPFGAYLDRNYLGLPDLRPLPWEADVEDATGGGRRDGGGVGGGLGLAGGGGGGISRFASDDELLDSGPPARGGSATATMSAGTRHTGLAGVPSGKSGDGTSVFDDPATSPVARALRRKLADQQRLVRVMAVVLAVVAIVSIVTNLDELASLFGGPGAGTAPAGTGELREAGGHAEPTAPAEQVLATESGMRAAPPPAPPQPLPQDSQPSGTAEPEAPAAPAANGPDLGRAMQLIAAAGQTDRPLADRIRDYEQAIEILSVAPADGAAPPPNLTETLTGARRELERLRLERDFFGRPQGS